MSLRAKLPILYMSRQYRIGDILPANNERMVQAWVNSGAAFWDTVESQKKAPKATLATAEPGLPGRSSNGDPEALVGKVSKTPQRKRTTKK